MKIKLIALFILVCGFSFCNNFANATTNSQMITIKNGWNIISTPRIVESHNFSVEENSNNFDIYILDPNSTSKWTTMSQLNQTEFTPLFGYFINNKTGVNQTLTLSYKQNVSPNERLFSRVFSTNGWYSIGIANPSYSIKQHSVTGTDTNNPSRILNSLGGNYSSVLDFTKENFISSPDSVALGDIWENKTEEDINGLNDFRDLKGYAIYINNSGVNYEGFQNNDEIGDIIKTAGELEVTANNSNTERVVILSKNETTTDVELAKVDIKAKSNSSTLKTLKVTVATTGDTNESHVIPTIKLYDGSTLLSSQSVADAGAIVFDSLTVAIAKDTTKTLTIKGDFAKIATGNFGEEGATVMVALTGITQTDIVAEDANYDIVTTAHITATTAIGKKVYTYNVAPTLTFVSSSIALKSDSAMKQADGTLVFDVTANGGDIFFEKDTLAEFGTLNEVNDGTVAELSTTTSVASWSTDAPLSAGADNYVIANGQTKRITISYLIDPADAGFNYANMTVFKWDTDDDNTLDYTAVWNLDNFKTPAIYLAN